MSMFLEIFRVPSVGMGFLRIWERNLLVFKANAIETALTVAVEPLVFYWALAYGLGQYVELINGMSFVEYLFPGFMLLTSMSVAYSETSHNCYLKITPRGHYSNYQYTPLRQSEIAMGEILWGAFKGFLAGACISAFAYQQDFFVLKNLGSVAVALLLTSILFSSLGLLVMTHVKNYESFSVAYALILLPMYLLSGALFPLDALPEAYTYVSLAFPLTHSLMFLRSSLVEIYDTQFYIHILVVMLTALFATNFAVARFEARFRK